MHKSISDEDFLNEYKLVDSFCCLVVNFFLVLIQNLLNVYFMLFSSHCCVLVYYAHRVMGMFIHAFQQYVVSNPLDYCSTVYYAFSLYLMS